MNFRSTDPARDDLHRLFACAVTANVGEISSACGNHLVPCKKRLLREWLSK